MSKDDIIRLCKKYQIKNYTINSDMSIDVAGNVYITEFNLGVLPLSFIRVHGDFMCTKCQLTTLEGCPKFVGGGFSCWYNQLTSLKYGPEHVGGLFNCTDNSLTSLDYLPNYIGCDFYCFNNKLIHRQQIPECFFGAKMVRTSSLKWKF